jgi:hypothetical protein
MLTTNITADQKSKIEVYRQEPINCSGIQNGVPQEVSFRRVMATPAEVPSCAKTEIPEL